MSEDYVGVAMQVDELSLVPVAPLPPGLTVREYRDGDEETWTRIHQATGTYGDVPASLFREQFGDDEDALARRQIYLDDADGNAVATTTAWFPEDDIEPHLGRIHWVAVVPSWQRRGVGRFLVRATCERFAELGYTGAYLTTGAQNAPAIATYLACGFVPRPRSDVERDAWRRLGH